MKVKRYPIDCNNDIERDLISSLNQIDPNQNKPPPAKKRNRKTLIRTGKTKSERIIQFANDLQAAQEEFEQIMHPEKVERRKLEQLKT